MNTATASSWDDFVAQSIKYFTKDGGRVIQNKDVTIFSPPIPWSFETDPAKGNYTIAVLYLPKFVPAPTLNFNFGDGAHKFNFTKSEDKTYGVQFLRFKCGANTLGRLIMQHNGTGSSSSVRVIVVEH